MAIARMLQNTINSLSAFNELRNYVILDKECRILKVSKEICQLLTYKEDELLSRDVGVMLSYTGNAQREAFKEEVISQNFTYHQGKLLANKHGKFISSDIYVYKKLLPNNTLVYVALIMGDLNYQAELEKKYLEKSLELNTFIYRTSHDLRGPLCTLSGLMNIFKLESSGHTTHNLIELIEGTINKLDCILSDLVNIAEANAGIVSKPVHINMHALLYRTIGKVGESYNIYDSLFKIDIEQKEEFVNYENLFSSILFNLIAYAIQNLVPERVGIVKIDIKQQSDKSVFLRIEDNGQGISREIQGRVFEMFFKTNTHEPAGLGLYMVKNYTEYMGGSVELESKQGSGTVIKLHIPSLKAVEN
jgi:signal transduction histidine kinase